MLKDKKVIVSLIILGFFVLILGLHGGSEYYFRDFCVHKTLNMFYNFGSPEFFKKPNFVCDILAPVYGFFYIFLKIFNIVPNFDEFVRLFTINYIETPMGNISFMLPALIVNNIFAIIGVFFVFLTTYILTDKKVLPSFISGFILTTTYGWMNFSHHLAVDLPLTAMCVMTVFFALYFIQNKTSYTYKNIIVLGVLSGLCASTKYNGALVLITPLLMILLTEKSKKQFLYKSFVLILCSSVAFFITNIHILIKFKHFFSDFLFEYKHAFIYGHQSADDSTPFLYHLFHSIPNLVGITTFILSIIGGSLFLFAKNIPTKIKCTLIIFPLSFYLMMSFSKLIFLRYMLPIIPYLIIFVGFLINYILKSVKSKIFYSVCITLMAVFLCFNGVNALHFYKIMNYKDSRVEIKNIFKTLNYGNPNLIFYSDIFSNPYYEEDFLNQFPYLKEDIKKFLYYANNHSIEIVPKKHKDILKEYDVIFFDGNTFDRSMQVRKDLRYENLENQYFMYRPFRYDNFMMDGTGVQLYVAQINPYSIDKNKVPFDFLHSDFKYRKFRGPFVEIYFKDEKLRDDFVKKCNEAAVECKSLNMEDGYYYNNIVYNLR
jgi:hypothetical protein